MKAILWTKYGPPELLEPGELEKPTPKPDEVLIKIHCATVTAGDCEIRRFQIHPLFWLPLRLIVGITRPKRPLLGQEFSGTIKAVGSEVTTYSPGDKVLASTGMNFGTYCEYRCQKASTPMSHIPEGVSFEQATTIPTGGINGLHFLKNADMKAGQHLLINGAGGSIGTYTLQLSKNMGIEVTCVDHATKLEMLTANGADHVLDYEKDDFTEKTGFYDAVIDISGHVQYSRALRSLKPNGTLVLGNPATSQMFRSIWTNLRSKQKVKWDFAGETLENLDYLANLIAKRKVNPVIDKRYPLEGVIEAHQFTETGLKQGNVIINVTR
ncbi:MAG: NAD(P)-dependent alcohol dehydrogenase [Cytophagales bacterium]|nr:NAD(P)-dependent alcohol dehydrogenase [Cytophagales bacterium]